MKSKKELEEELLKIGDELNNLSGEWLGFIDYMDKKRDEIILRQRDVYAQMETLKAPNSRRS